jgi:hypothetical protein
MRHEDTDSSLFLPYCKIKSPNLESVQHTTHINQRLLALLLRCPRSIPFTVLLVLQGGAAMLIAAGSTEPPFL